MDEKKGSLKFRGFTDRLYFLNLTLSWLFIIVCIVMTALEGRLGITDLSIASVGIPAVFAELGAKFNPPDNEPLTNAMEDDYEG